MAHFYSRASISSASDLHKALTGPPLMQFLWCVQASSSKTSAGKTSLSTLRPFSTTYSSSPIVAIPVKTGRKKQTATALSISHTGGSSSVRGNNPPAAALSGQDPILQGPLRPAWNAPSASRQQNSEVGPSGGEDSSGEPHPTPSDDGGAGPSSSALGVGASDSSTVGGVPTALQVPGNPSGRNVPPKALRQGASPRLLPKPVGRAAVPAAAVAGGGGSPPVRLAPSVSASGRSPPRPCRVPPAILNSSGRSIALTHALSCGVL